MTTEKPGETIELVLKGLPAGQHSLVDLAQPYIDHHRSQRIGVRVDDGAEQVIDATCA